MTRAIPLSPSDVRFGRWLVVLNGAIPAALLLTDALRHQLGANPANFAIRSTGFLALVSIVAFLLVTPLVRLTGQPWLGNFRRALGLYAFFYALAHFGLFFWLDRELSVASTLNEMSVRPYLAVGSIGLFVMVPLAVTSTNGMIRRLGPRNWKRLHRLAYVAAIAGVAHYYMLQKADVRWPVIYATVIGGLLAFRLVGHYFDLRLAARMAAKPAKVPARPKFWKGKLRLAATFDETPEVRTFRLVPADGSTSMPFDHRPGQYLNLSLDVDGRRVNRSYTIASSPSRVGHVELTVKREPQGESSRYLHERAKVGDLLDVAAPAGRFVFDGTQSPSLVMLAAGVGVTPLMSVLRFLTDLAWPGDVYFVYAVRTERDIIFRDELERLAGRHKNLHLTITLTKPDETWKGERGRIDRAMLERLVPDLASRRVHVCGPTRMIDDTVALLRQMGVPQDMIAIESFVTPAREKAATRGATMTDAQAAAVTAAATASGAMADAYRPPAEGTYQLTFSTSGKTVEVPADQTILEAAEAAGVAINSDCRSGICGTCKVRLANGSVTMAVEDSLTASDRLNRVVLACQARCTDDVKVEA